MSNSPPIVHYFYGGVMRTKEELRILGKEFLIRQNLGINMSPCM